MANPARIVGEKKNLFGKGNTRRVKNRTPEKQKTEGAKQKTKRRKEGDEKVIGNRVSEPDCEDVERKR